MQDGIDDALRLLPCLLFSGPEEKNAIHDKKLQGLPAPLNEFRNCINGAHTDKKELTAFLCCHTSFDGGKEQVIVGLGKRALRGGC